MGLQKMAYGRDWTALMQNKEISEVELSNLVWLHPFLLFVLFCRLYINPDTTKDIKAQE